MSVDACWVRACLLGLVELESVVVDTVSCIRSVILPSFRDEAPKTHAHASSQGCNSSFRRPYWGIIQLCRRAGYRSIRSASDLPAIRCDPFHRERDKSESGRSVLQLGETE